MRVIAIVINIGVRIALLIVRGIPRRLPVGFVFLQREGLILRPRGCLTPFPALNLLLCKLRER